jgi:hypothetical protein
MAKRTLEVSTPVEYTQAPDDARGLWVNGLLVLHNGEMAGASLYYPSTTNKNPTAGVPYCLQLNSMHEEQADEVADSQFGFHGGPSAHAALGDDKYFVTAYRGTADGSFVTVLVQGLHTTHVPRYEHNKRKKTCQTPEKWQDAQGRLWRYDSAVGYYSLGDTTARKYQFIPHKRSRKQAQRDLLTVK